MLNSDEEFCEKITLNRLPWYQALFYVTEQTWLKRFILGNVDKFHLIFYILKFFFFFWLYNLGWVLLCSTILFHTCLSSIFTLQPAILIFFSLSISNSLSRLPCICPKFLRWTFAAIDFLRGAVASSTPNPQPGGPGYLSFSGCSPSTCPAWVALPVATVPPA